MDEWKSRRRHDGSGTILGMMLGSFYAIVQGPTTLDVPKAAMTFSTFQITASLVGVLLVLGLQLIKEKNEETSA